MSEIDIPRYFLCPISLQIMRDPVTTITGITYDRHSIDQWLATGEPVCPVTRQPLPRPADLTPNLTLHRVIQAWCASNMDRGVDPIPAPKPPPNPGPVLKLVEDLRSPQLFMISLKKLEDFAMENEIMYKKCLLECGVAKEMVSLIITCHKGRKYDGFEQALRILHSIWSPTPGIKSLVSDNYDLIDSIIWVLNGEFDFTIRSLATVVMRKITEIASSNIVERLKPDFFIGMMRIIREERVGSTQSRRGGYAAGSTKAALCALIELSKWGRNRTRMVDAGATTELIELELSGPEKKVTELIFSLLAQLCSSADGRAQLLAHGAGLAVISKRILRVSATVNDRAVHIFSQLAKWSATKEMLQEMLSAGCVSKLCMLMQANSAKYLKDRVRDILRLHSHVWKDSPCIQVYLLTR